MITGVVYLVTKESDDGTFLVGDHISLNDDGSINCREAGGWVEAEDAVTAVIGMEVQVDRVWLNGKKDRLSKDMEFYGNL